MGLHINVVFEQGEIHYSTRNKNSLYLTRFNRTGSEEMSIGEEKMLPDPPRELPFWSDSFVHLHQDWSQMLQDGAHSTLLPVLAQGLHIQEVMETF